MAMVQMREADRPLGWIGQALVQASLANWAAAANLSAHAIQSAFHVRTLARTHQHTRSVLYEYSGHVHIRGRTHGPERLYSFCCAAPCLIGLHSILGLVLSPLLPTCCSAHFYFIQGSTFLFGMISSRSVLFSPVCSPRSTPPRKSCSAARRNLLSSWPSATSWPNI